MFRVYKQREIWLLYKLDKYKGIWIENNLKLVGEEMKVKFKNCDGEFEEVTAKK